MMRNVPGGGGRGESKTTVPGAPPSFGSLVYSISKSISGTR